MGSARQAKKSSRRERKRSAASQQREIVGLVLKEVVGKALDEPALRKLVRRHAGSLLDQVQDVQTELRRLEDLGIAGRKHRDEASIEREMRARMIALALWRRRQA